jgi:hypothetical protein
VSLSRTAAVVSCLLVSACEGSTDPSPYSPSDVAGHWTGTASGFSLDATLGAVSCDVMCGGALTGTYTDDSRAVTATFDGSYFISPNPDGGDEEHVILLLNQDTSSDEAALWFLGRLTDPQTMAGSVTDRFEPDTIGRFEVALTLDRQQPAQVRWGRRGPTVRTPGSRD